MDLSDSLDGAFEAARKAPAPWKHAAPGEQLRVLGYEVFLVPQSGDEGVEDMIEDEKQQRRDREEAGRSARWG